MFKTYEIGISMFVSIYVYIYTYMYIRKAEYIHIQI